FCLPYGYALCIILKMGQYAQSAGAVCSLKYHLVWCPKYRRPVLVGAVDRRLKALLQQKTKELHIHITPWRFCRITCIGSWGKTRPCSSSQTRPAVLPKSSIG